MENGIFYHGTGKRYANSITKNGLDAGSYITNDFGFAASYAMRHKNPVVLVFENIPVELPEDIAFENEFVTAAISFPSKIVSPVFKSIPEDWWETADDLSERKYPELFNIENWR